MLFVARGFSRAYEVANFPGCGFEDCIYFLDNRNSADVVVVSQFGIIVQYSHSYDGSGWAQLVEDEPIRRYTYSDNGRCRWVDGESRLQVFKLWFSDKELSNYSAQFTGSWCCAL